MGMVRDSFNNWLRKTKVMTKNLSRGMGLAWPYYDPGEIKFMRGIRKVEEEKRDGLYGSSVLRSKVIALNPKVLRRDGLMWATSALHEAEHGINGTDEGPATTREFNFLGKVYKDCMRRRDRSGATKAMKAAIIAMRQRKRMCEPKVKKDDHNLLTRYGFSDKAASTIMEA